jgi:hypothetical protein
MFIVTAQNVTGNNRLSRPDGTAKYCVWVGINQHCIFKGTIDNHVRDDGGAKLLRLIAEEMEKQDA